MHWACYSKSEIALVYLLSWVSFLDDQDCEGYTPLHLAVRSVETLKSTRPVRALLIRGAPRNMKDHKGRMPIDLVQDITSLSLKQTLLEDLVEPRTIECLMIKTPLKKVNKSYTTILFMWFLMFIVYISITLLIFPFYSVSARPVIIYCFTIFAFTLFVHLLLISKNAGYL